MKLRIIPSSIGSLATYDWKRIYKVQIKTFLFWRELKRCESIDEAKAFAISVTDWNELIFVKYL
jgi:hypothetical protein